MVEADERAAEVEEGIVDVGPPLHHLLMTAAIATSRPTVGSGTAPILRPSISCSRRTSRLMRASSRVGLAGLRVNDGVREALDPRGEVLTLHSGGY